MLICIRLFKKYNAEKHTFCYHHSQIVASSEKKENVSEKVATSQDVRYKEDYYILPICIE